MSARETTVYIVRGTPLLSNSYEHSLYFPNKTAQESYFAGKVVKTFSAYTYHRKQWNVKVQASIETAQNWTYVYFRNFDGKTYYYFITDVSYINENTVELALELDVLQTYMFDWDLRECFIERNHVANDTVGANTIDEGLEIGEYMTDFTDQVDELTDLCILILLTTEDNGTAGYSKLYGNVFSGLRLVAVLPSDHAKLASWMCTTSGSGLNALAVVNMWMYPKSLIKVVGDWGSANSNGMHTVSTTLPCELKIPTYKYKQDPSVGGKLNTFGGNADKIRNNKLFCYPYNYLYLSNNSGGQAVYRYEWFDDGKTPTYADFTAFGGLSPECGVGIAPWKYRGSDEEKNFDEGLLSGAFPTCAWDADGYKIFLATNRNQLATAEKNADIVYGNSMLGSLSGLNLNPGDLFGLGNVANSALNATTQHTTTINSLMAQKKDAKLTPDTAKGAFGGSINVAHERHTFTVEHKSIRWEFAERIDQYFSRYGYKVNRIETPSIHNRRCFTYIKTVGCLVGGDFPVGDRNTVARVFDNGVTFWDPDKCVPGYFNVDNPTL